jgi:hypothetical protein
MNSLPVLLDAGGKAATVDSGSRICPPLRFVKPVGVFAPVRLQKIFDARPTV